MLCWKTNLPGLPKTTQPRTESSRLTSVSYHRPNKSQGQGAWFPSKPAIQAANLHAPLCRTKYRTYCRDLAIHDDFHQWKRREEGAWQETKKARPIKKKKRKKTAVIATGKQRHKPQLCMYASPANAWIWRQRSPLQRDVKSKAKIPC